MMKSEMKKTLLLTAEKYQILPVKGRYFTQECINHEVQAQVYFAYIFRKVFISKSKLQVYLYKVKFPGL